MGYFTTLSVTRLYSAEWYRELEKDSEGSGNSLIRVLCHNLHGETKKNHKKPLSK
jgi:hypothetical protein